MRWMKGLLVGLVAALVWWFAASTAVVLTVGVGAVTALALLASTVAIWGYVGARVVRSGQKEIA